MRYRNLGNSDLEVSEIALGSWLTYGVGVKSDSARNCLAVAFDCGINFIDTANVYGKGAAETFLGEALAGRARDSYVLATKLYFPMTDTDSGLSAKQVHKQIDDSLHRLRTDYVDLYQCHRYDPDTPLEETMRALDEVVKAGKARYIGFSEWTAPQIQAAMDKLMQGRTTLVIAHRLSTVTSADLIYVIDKGCVIEQGTHVELMVRGGNYQRLYNLQFAEEAETSDAVRAAEA